MKGRRLPDARPDQLPHEFYGKLWPGDYVYLPRVDGWLVCAPNGTEGSPDRKTWTITVHEDQTITVSPSIDVRADPRWHGFLEKGVWRAVG